MNCFPCLRRQRIIKEDGSPRTAFDDNKHKVGSGAKPETGGEIGPADITSQHFTFHELASATRNFCQECSLGEGGFGKVYKGTLPGTDQEVAVNQLDRHALQGNKEFMVEVLMLSQLHHESLVKLVGYCADGDQRLLVYEYMSGGSLEDHLFDIKPDKKPLDWLTRMRIAFAAAQGLEYLHNKAEPAVIYRDLKCSNVLMDSDYNPKLSAFGLAKLGPANDKMNVSSSLMGTYGYCPPEYTRLGQLTVKSDVYSFGVLLLELITGRNVFDGTKPMQEQNLITWAQPKFRDPKSFPDIADPLLEHRFPQKGLNQAVAIAAMCLQEEPSVRPLMIDVVATLSFLVEDPPQSMSAPIPESLPSEERVDTAKSDSDKEDGTYMDGHASGGSDAKAKDGHSKCVHAGVERDEEDDYFPYLVLEDKEYASSDSSSTISFSLGGRKLLRERSSKPRSGSISSNRRLSMAFLEKSISSRNISGNWSRNSSQMSNVEDHLSSPRDRNFSPSSSRSSSDSSHYEIDFTTQKGREKSPLSRLEFSSRDKDLDVPTHGSCARSRDDNAGNSLSPRSTRSREGNSFGPDFGQVL